MKSYAVVIEKDEDGYYVASVPAIPGCYTQARNLDTLMKKIHEAIELCIESGMADEGRSFIGVQNVVVGRHGASAPG